MSEEQKEGSGGSRFLDRFESLWSHALVAVSAAEEEAAKVVSQMSQVMGIGPEEGKRQLRLWTERLSLERQSLESKLDEAVMQSLNKLRMPRRDDMLRLSGRLEDLERRVELLSRPMKTGGA